SSSAEIGSSSAEGSSSSEEESSSSSVIASSSSAEESSSSEEVSSSSEEESSSSSVIASSSSAKQSSSSFEVSSSSEEESSSSEEESSSSVVFPEGVMSAGYYKDNCPSGHTCTDAAPSTYLKSGITYGEILDTRDYQVYKTVKICNDDKSSCQTWMAQNLNYDPGNVSSMGEYAWSGCYDDAASNCSKYGRLYTWAAAIDSVALANDADDSQTCGYGETCTLPTVVQGICPEGWHLPTYAEWDTLITNVGGENVAGRMLKSEEGWNYYPESTEGIDYYGLSALPAGSRSFDGFFFNAGDGADFWSSSEDGSDVAYTMYLYYHYENADLYYGRKNHANSVRCLKD
ncbi:MAG: fibrobacter succinogenes major paralogous domain-containing protein, partial [Fibrobacter sp.]|nr:fibrobacter succinogenes major paralogous domain-containing protein [Fibrobacter sp.]